ncbi:sterol desaturase family protein [Prosthecomicrobium sp. N25]|uniref:sterol desaturase family protein n=1 Tax=Prosthecomicrobium sp. N25 TaxID=3129254 RepID=UPI0030780F97
MIEELWRFLDLQRGIVLALIFIPFETLLPLHPDQKTLRKGFGLDLVYLVLNGLLIKAALFWIIMLILAAGPAIVPESVRTFVQSRPLWLQVIGVLLVGDLGFYWAHRMFHHVPWLWRFHRIHHSIEELDWLAAHRVHALDQIVTKTVSLAPCYALGFSEAALLIFAVVYGWHSILLHANVSIRFGPLERVIASPVFHHWHHANEPEAYDRNFAGQFSLWDHVFGTAYRSDRLPARYGTDDPVPEGFAAQALDPFRPRRT